MALHDLRKVIDGLHRWSLEIQHFYRIERNHIHVAQPTAKQIAELVSDLIAIVDAVHQRVLEADASAGLGDVAIACGQEVLHGPATIDWHQTSAEFVVRGVEAHSQVDLQWFIGQRIDAGDDSGGADSDATSSEVQTTRIVDDIDELHCLFVVLQGFAHAHHHQIGEIAAELLRLAGSIHRLLHNLTGAEAASESTEAGSTEGTTHSTANLTAHAYCGAIWIEHENCFHNLAIEGLVEQLVGISVIGHLLIHQLHGGERESFFHLILQDYRNILHVSVRFYEILVSPVVHLFGAESWSAELLEFRLEILERAIVKADEALAEGNWFAGYRLHCWFRHGILVMMIGEGVDGSTSSFYHCSTTIRRTTMRIDINSDLGESFGDWAMGNDTDMLQLVSSANIACGFHAGDPRVMLATVEACAANNVAVGAHPGYPDLVGFGRRHMTLTRRELKTDVIYQIGAMQAMCRAAGVPLHHVKPHGAMQNKMAVDYEMSVSFIEAMVAVMDDPLIYAQPGSATEKAALDTGIRVAREVFADRAYLADGQLAPRSMDGAVLHDPEAIASRMQRILAGEAIETIDGGSLRLEGDTICVHGDTLDAVGIARVLRKSLTSSGFLISPV